MVSMEGYMFDRQKLTVPLHLQHMIPIDTHGAMQQIRTTAMVALHHLKLIEKLHRKRHQAMCPRSLVEHYDLHVESVERLFNWKSSPKLHDSSLSPVSKISRDVLHFHINQHAYDAYARSYTATLETYISGPYKEWLDAKRNFEKRMANAGLSEKDYHEWQKWWTTVFLAEMAKWENQLPKLALPSWEEAIDEIHQVFLERVEPGTFPEFYISSDVQVDGV